MNKNKRIINRVFKGTEGLKVYSVATGVINPFKKASRQASKLMTSQEGFIAMHTYNKRGVLWFYDSLNAAKGARNIATANGIKCGDNICLFIFESGCFVCKGEQ